MRCAEVGEDRNFYVLINNRKVLPVEGNTREAVYKTTRNMISHLGIFTNKQVWVNYLKEYIQVGFAEGREGIFTFD